jgi:DNA-binding NtrC family response regulator
MTFQYRLHPADLRRQRPFEGKSAMTSTKDSTKIRQLKDKHILLVDDDAWIRDSMSICLSCEGCRVTTAKTAREGLQALQQGGVDILICDYQLPDRDGLDLLREAKSIAPQVPMILITAFGSRQLYAQAAAIGVDIFIDKPFNSHTIEHAITRLLENPPKGTLP